MYSISILKEREPRRLPLFWVSNTNHYSFFLISSNNSLPAMSLCILSQNNFCLRLSSLSIHLRTTSMLSSRPRVTKKLRMLIQMISKTHLKSPHWSGYVLIFGGISIIAFHFYLIIMIADFGIAYIPLQPSE